ncbi:class I SAM-dependent methyltransferase [Candidatus Omnitrophota bacterium]
MAECTICNICAHGSDIAESKEVVKVRSNVRAHADQSFTVWRCPNCSSLHRKEDVQLAEYYKGYPYDKQSQDFFTRILFSRHLSFLIRSGLKKRDSILDFGCSQGLFVSYLQDHGYPNVCGYDSYVQRSSDKKILSRSYDFIFLQDVIEHLDNPIQLMRSLIDSLNPDGSLFIGTPNAEYIDLSKHEEYIHALHQPYHMHILSERALVDFAKNESLSISKVSKWNYLDTPIPLINTRFMLANMKYSDNTLDAGFEPLRLGQILRTPLLIFHGIIGAVFPYPVGLAVIFKKGKHIACPQKAY